jgi:flagellar biosynthetic protein FliQ
MDIAEVVEIGQRTVFLALLLASPILLTGLVVGVVVSVLQAVTQVQEQTLSFVPKILAMMVALALLLPWLTNQMVAYTQQTYLEYISMMP